MARTLIRAHTLLTQSAIQPVVRSGGITIEDGVIREVGPLAELERKGPYDTVLGDQERHLALPGFINGHHHSLRPARIGLRSSPLESWLARSRERQLPALSPDQVYDHTLWGTLQFLKSGVTAVVDHYPFDPRLEDLGVPASIQAYLDAGVRAAVCVACSDQQRYVYEDDEAFLARLPTDLGEALRVKLRPFDRDAFLSLWGTTRGPVRWPGRANPAGLRPGRSPVVLRRASASAGFDSQ